MKHRYQCQLRRADMDAYRHVNNVVYAMLMAEARAEMLGELPPLAAVAEHSVIARQRIRYLRPLVFRQQPVGIECWVSRVGTSSMTVEHEIRDGDIVYCHSTTVIVAVDAATEAPRPIGQEERAALATLTAD